MGAWGTALYANDTACDLKADYIEKIKIGKSSLLATQELVSEYQACLNDSEEAPLFWFALADTQWNYGRLLPEVRDKALYFLACNEEQERWAESDASKHVAWQKTLAQLYTKLSTPQPKEKIVRRTKLYRCPWNLGDVFAYRLSGEYSKVVGCYGKYVAFRKVSEDTWHPMHIIPVVQFFCWMGTQIPDLDSLRAMPVLPSFVKPHTVNKAVSEKAEKSLNLICESEKSIPKENLIFLGNIHGDDIVPFLGHDYWAGRRNVGWESSKYNHKFEHYIIDMFLAWNGHL